MASFLSMLQELFNVKGTKILDVHTVETKDCNIICLDVVPEEDKICPYCGAKCPGYDRRSKPRVWRTLDWGCKHVFFRYRPWRVNCPEHGVVTEAVPWASLPQSRFTMDFELEVAWLAKRMSRDGISCFKELDWKTIDRILRRVSDGMQVTSEDRFACLIHIAVDETSYQKGHKYITVVMDLVTNRIIWVMEGRGYNVFKQFFKGLTKEQRASIQTVSGDGAKWIDQCVDEFVPHARRCADPFHVVQWTMDALDRARLSTASRHRKEGGTAEEASLIRRSKYALGKSPENLTSKQKERLEFIQNTSPELYSWYELKEAVRNLLKEEDVTVARATLQHCCERAANSGCEPIEKLGEKLSKHAQSILNSIELKKNSARLEAKNNKIKTIIRRAYGFRNLDKLSTHILFCCSNVDVELPRC